MFKVMCVGSKNGWSDKYSRPTIKSYLWGLYTKTTHSNSLQNGPGYGETATVIQVVKVENEDYYALKEYPVNNRNEPATYQAKWFIPLSEIDERELINEKEKVEKIK